MIDIKAKMYTDLADKDPVKARGYNNNTKKGTYLNL